MKDSCFKSQVNIKKTETIYRSNHVQNVAYHLTISIPKGKKYFGLQTVHFDLKTSEIPDINLDFCGEQIHELKINNIVQNDENCFKDQRIVLNRKLLKQVGNQIDILFETIYSNDGTGLHTYSDPQDENQYLYSQFEAPYCHKLMPCFEQPNLKSSLTLQVIAPQDWQVVTNEKCKSKIDCDLQKIHSVLSQNHEKAQIWSFFTTPRISTYLFALCAGPYSMKELSNPKIVPMKLYCRKSLEKYLTSDYTNEWFQVQEHALSFYSDFMNIPYPYSKLDSVICPEYNFGAMENVGCITYTERILFKTEPQRKEQIWMQNVIMHELAHQWFGNLITMNWWDDLWLNEAFATFMACLCQNNYKDVGDEAWLDLIKHQQWGISEDQKKSTHPIATIATDTVEAENLFDGISYGKGSQFLKQLYKYLSPNVFKQGVRLYFSKYANGNTNLTEFVTCLEIAKGQAGVSDWVESWLTQQGVMDVKQELKCSNDKISSFKILQSFCPNADEKYKSHKMNIAFYYDEQVIIEEVLVLAQQETDLSEQFKNFKAPKAIQLDSGSHGYIKVQCDQESLQYLLDNYQKIQSVIDRLNIISVLVNLVRDAKYSALKFMKFVVNNLQNEKVALIRESLLSDLVLFLSYLKKEDLQRVSIKLFDEFIQNIKLTKDSQTIRGYVNKILSLLNNENNIQKALVFLKEGNIIGYQLNQQDKQSILIAANSLQNLKNEEKDKLIVEHLGDSKDSDVEKCRLSCLVIRPCLENKNKWWQDLIIPKDEISQDIYGEIAGSLLVQSQSELYGNHFVEQFFESLPKIFKDKVHFLARQFLYGCYPGRYQHGVDYTQRLQDVMNQNNEDKMLQKYGESVIDAYQRRLAGQKITVSNDWEF